MQEVNRYGLRGKNRQYVLALFFTWLQSTQIDPLFCTAKVGQNLSSERI